MAKNPVNENIGQAIDDFGTIKEAIVDKGVEVPTGTPTSSYGEKIRSISGGGDLSNYYTKSETDALVESYKVEVARTTENPDWHNIFSDSDANTYDEMLARFNNNQSVIAKITDFRGDEGNILLVDVEQVGPYIGFKFTGCLGRMFNGYGSEKCVTATLYFETNKTFYSVEVGEYPYIDYSTIDSIVSQKTPVKINASSVNGTTLSFQDDASALTAKLENCVSQGGFIKLQDTTTFGNASLGEIISFRNLYKVFDDSDADNIIDEYYAYFSATCYSYSNFSEKYVTISIEIDNSTGTITATYSAT